MRHGRRYGGRAGLRAEIDRFVARRRTRQANDDGADACAVRFIESLEKAALAPETTDHGFEHACRKAEHVEELRRVLGLLLDVLADWEMAVERTGGGR
ncbi:hypothetical protein [Actinomadura sp. DC4]|uniref:hypothetical protein n=1 Tax=Actinomadura sp. DC4 TaxID=3055069 RepID=UPI0025AFF9D3|nr:hypothetical protein [Actinomadura sp. DC4]MDN3352488.1 hypothetical protein [Actinomadura sp. DC4]